MKSILITAVAAAGTLLAAPAFAQGDVPHGDTYVCDEGSLDSPYIQVVLPSTADGNATLMLESEAIEMAPTPTGSGFAYDVMLPAGHYMVQGKGSDVLLLVDDQEPKTCTRMGMASDDTGSDGGYVSAMGNFSLGGNVRTGPGTEFDDIDSLPYGEPVSIVSGTGVMFDGYEWFEIEYSEGLRGFQWGGIMCSNALHIIGLYEECPPELE